MGYGREERHSKKMWTRSHRSSKPVGEKNSGTSVMSPREQAKLSALGYGQGLRPVDFLTPRVIGTASVVTPGDGDVPADEGEGHGCHRGRDQVDALHSEPVGRSRPRHQVEGVSGADQGGRGQGAGDAPQVLPRRQAARHAVNSRWPAVPPLRSLIGAFEDMSVALGLGVCCRLHTSTRNENRWATSW